MKLHARSLLQLCLSALTIVVPATASAALVAYDGFRLSMPVYGASGTGFNGPWVQDGPLFETGDPSLCYPGLSTSGFSLMGAAAPGFLSRQFAVPFGGAGSATYVSLVLQPESIGTGWGGFYLIGTAGVLFVGKPGGGATGHYVVETSGGAGQVASNVAVVPATPALIVLKIQFSAGADMVTLYANPVPGTGEPATGVVKADLDLGTVQSIALGGVDARFSFDEFRLGTTYADVVPVDGKKRCK